ncbi:MAG: DUF1565 domain-containing protein [Candidatus Coatesbacteria bacterium]|nr:DUF1565 domain-containing protein [Candidatus Coatesbacteria bacterium]
MKWESRALFFITFLLIAASSCLALAGHYYVSSDAGNDSNDGSEENPWLTLTHALDWIDANDPGSSSNAQIIHIAAGTYSPSTNGETFPLNMQSWVSLTGNTPDTTVLDAEGGLHVICCLDVSNLSIENLTLTGGNARGTESMDQAGGGIFSESSSLTITNNTTELCI